jgi:hypothetical protein
MTPEPRRRVRRLALRAPTEALARRTAIALEDALHTASLPDGDGSRVVIIRRLALGRIRPDLSPVQLALAIEQRVWEAGSAAVYALDAEAARASVVYFRDEAEPLVLLARRLARRQPAHEWFWRSAVRGWRQGASGPDAWRDLLASAARQDGAPAVLARIVRALLEDGTCDSLCASMQVEDAFAWLERCGWSPRSAAGAARSPRVVPDLLTGTTLSLLEKWVATWGPPDIRSQFWATVLLVAERRAHVGDPDLPAYARRAIEVASHARFVRIEGRDGVTGPRLDVEPPPRAGNPSLERVSRERDIPPPPGERAAFTARLPPDDPASPQRDDPRAVQSLEVVRLPDGVFSSHAGLFFVLQLLHRLRIAHALQQHPEWVAADLPGRLLDRVAGFARIPACDPVLMVLAERRSVHPGDEQMAAVVEDWMAAMRRWCWRHPRMRLTTLVRTAGRVSATETHVDLHFDLRQSDVRVRRAGLDLDPGWVPWFGRVVRFHYGASHG